jgi:hypothetical protein
MSKQASLRIYPREELNRTRKRHYRSQRTYARQQAQGKRILRLDRRAPAA